MSNTSKQLGELDTSYMNNQVFWRARLKLTAIYTAGVTIIFVAGFILNSWLDKVLAETRVDPLLHIAEGLIIILVGIASFYFAGRTLRPIEASYKQQKKFVANAAHELRTPLTVMKTGAEATLAGDSSSIAYKKLIHESLEEIDYMTTTVNDLLFLARNENPKKAEFRRVDLKRLVIKQVEFMTSYARKKSVDLRLDCKNKVYVNGNEAHLKRLLANLLQNAIDYNKPGGSVIVSLRANKQTLELTVFDTGFGIPDKDLGHIFDRFYKVDKARMQQSGGAGLGLAIVKEIVSAHGGRVIVRSQLGKETSVIVTLPASS